MGLFYRSANFDEEVFDSPERFDIRRDPNPQLGFGGTGTHYCLGANLARLEIDLMFNAIADGMPSIRRAGRRGAAALRLAQRHQAAAGQLPLTMALTIRTTIAPGLSAVLSLGQPKDHWPGYDPRSCGC